MFKIFPATLTSDNKKIPLIRDWQSLATDNQEQIVKWQQQFGSHLTFWGIPCGSTNGIIALDIDIKTVDGFQSIVDNNLDIPETMSQTTMTGGKHYVYKLPEGLTVGNTTGTYGKGIDTRGQGGWIAYYGFDKTPMVDAPEWLLKPKEKSTKEIHNNFKIEQKFAEEMLVEICYDVINAPPGESNDLLNKKSFQAAQDLISTGSLPHETVFNYLFQAAKQRGKTDHEARATINSGINAGIKVAPTINCPFTPQPVQNMATDPTRWTPPETTFDGMMDESKLRKPQLFKDWSTEDIHITTADGGTGKTTLALYESVCLALGERFLGFECLQPGAKTLFLIGEDDTEKTVSVLGAICRQMKLTPERFEKVRKSIFIKKDTDMCFITKDRLGFLHPNHSALEKLLQAINDIKPKRIVIDPIASFWGSEAALNDMSKAVAKFAGLLRDRSGAQVELINHMGKSSSQSKDVTQFAGRGGSALPSHSRVGRVYRSLDKNEYFDLTGNTLEQGQALPLFCQVTKFTDGSPLLNNPFTIFRTNYSFERVNITKELEEEVDTKADIEYVYEFLREARLGGKYVTKEMTISMMRQHMSKDRTVDALNILQFKGFDNKKIDYVDNPDMSKSKVIIFTDLSGQEIGKENL
jgi:RecA-family ATPase